MTLRFVYKNYTGRYIFPFDPIEPYYLMGSPIFPEVILHLDNGSDFKIIVKNVSEDNFYIRSAKLNGEVYDPPWIEYKVLTEGGILEFEMGSEPKTEWGKYLENLPFQLSVNE